MLSSRSVTVDNVAGRYHIETPSSAAALVKLHALFDVGGTQSWLPSCVFAGVHGAGKTTLAERFVFQAQRVVACDLVARARTRRDAPLGLTSDNMLRREAERREVERQDLARRVHDFGGCLRICSPAAFVEEENLDRAIHASMHGDGRRDTFEQRVYQQAVARAQAVEPAGSIPICDHPSADWVFSVLVGQIKQTPGNQRNDPLRRTRFLFLDRADRLLRIRDNERRRILDVIEDQSKRFTVVLIGTPLLASAIQADRVTQVIEVTPMPCDEVFAEVVHLVFGRCEPEEVQKLHAASGGVMGPLLHVAALRGLTPPYCVPQSKIRSLPAPS